MEIEGGQSYRTVEEEHEAPWKRKRRGAGGERSSGSLGRGENERREKEIESKGGNKPGHMSRVEFRLLFFIFFGLVWFGLNLLGPILQFPGFLHYFWAIFLNYSIPAK